ncbi:MAG: hypothetical protein KIS85_08390 [Anaerolineales bacterium]|nr:hypothetical protein [Anaerolineales bacterium]
MDTAALTAAVQAQMVARGCVPLPPGGAELRFGGPGGAWRFALAAEQTDAGAYLHAFETAMQRLLAVGDGQAAERLGLALAFGSTAAGLPLTYRRALKKYSNAVVFEDLGIHLWLFLEPDQLIELAPAEVNPFLRDLNRWIAVRRSSASV